MQLPASATRVADIGNEGNAHVRRNKLQTQRISGHGSEHLGKRTDGKRKAFAYALGSLCSGVPASLASISARVCVPESYRVHAHAPRTSRCDNPAKDLSTTMYQSGRLRRAGAAGGVGRRGREKGRKEATTHLKDVALAADDEPSRWLLVPLLGTTHVALAPRSHWFIGTCEQRPVKDYFIS